MPSSHLGRSWDAPCLEGVRESRPQKRGPRPWGQGLPHRRALLGAVSWEVAARVQQPAAPSQGEEGRGEPCGASARRVLLGSLAPRRGTEKRPWVCV